MIYLVRHGESQANANKRFCGITDVELSDLGRKHGEKAGLNLINFNILHIYSSPLKRALETAGIIKNKIGFKNDIWVEESIKEVNFGIFENMTWEEIQALYKEESDNWIKLGFNYKFPEGESYEDIMRRCSEFLSKIKDDSVVVTHYGIIQGILLCLKIAAPENIWDYRISNCDIVVLKEKRLEQIIRCL